jgi:hypothetical protein
VAPCPPVTPLHEMLESVKNQFVLVCLLCLMLGGDARAHSGALAGVRDPENTASAEMRTEVENALVEFNYFIGSWKWANYIPCGVCSVPLAIFIRRVCLLRLVFFTDGLPVQINTKINLQTEIIFL